MISGLREYAEAMAWAIEHGLEAPRDALDWACLLVAEQSEAPEELIELAGAVRAHPADVARLLRNLPGPIDRSRVLRKIFAKYLDLLGRDPSAWSQVTAGLEQMAINGEVPEPLDRPCRSFDDQLALAKQGVYGDPNQVKAELLTFLEAEAESASSAGVLAFATRFRDSNHPGWVECVLTDASEHHHVFVEKVPVVTTDDLNARSAYPQPVVLPCVITAEFLRPDGTRAVRIDTSEPLDIRSTSGQTHFSVARGRVIAGRIPPGQRPRKSLAGDA